MRDVVARTPGEGTTTKETVMSAIGEPISFDQHIKPLFRDRDRESMLSSFDLWSHDDVARLSDSILARLRDGSMPCDGAWPDEQGSSLPELGRSRKPA